MIRNVGACPAGDLMQFLAETLPDFDWKCFRCDAADWGCPSLRFRMYIVGTMTCFTLQPAHEWHASLQELRVPRNLNRMDLCLLSPKSPEVKAEQVRLLKTRLASSGVGTSSSARWRKTHAACREAFAAQGRVVEPAVCMSSDELLRKMNDSRGVILWRLLYTEREHDLILLMEAELQRRGMPSDANVFFDITEPTAHSRMIANNMLPTQLRTHRIHWVKGQRHVLGIEQLLSMGFPRNVSTRGVSDPQLRALAGNSMSVHFICALITLTLMYVDLQTPALQRDCKRRHAPAAEPHIYLVGPHNYTTREYTTKEYLPGLDCTCASIACQVQHSGSWIVCCKRQLSSTMISLMRRTKQGSSSYQDTQKQHHVPI